ncbi:MAG: hypothetical protein WDN29_03155 [Methylovirgula sp.]
MPPAHEPWIGAFMGAATGVVTGATGINVIPAVPYLQSLDLERDDLIQALGLSFTVSTMAMAAGRYTVACSLTHHGCWVHHYLPSSPASSACSLVSICANG